MIRFFIMLLAVAGIAELLSLRRSLFGVEYDVELSKTVAEPDEKFELITIISNHRRRFVPFLRLEEDVPIDLEGSFQLEIENLSEKRGTLKSSAYIMPRQKLIRRTQASLPKRGLYTFRGAYLSGGDFLGFSERRQRTDLQREIVILPKSADRNAAQSIIGGLLGDESVNRFMNEDPMLTIGFREYTGREPMKRISWKRSAHEGRLMVMEPDHTIERTAVVIVNANTFAFGSYGEEMLEKCFSIARSIMEELEEMRIPYSFVSNIAPACPTIGEGLGSAHLHSALVALGRAGYDFSESAWALVDRASLIASTGKTVILITPMRQDLYDANPERIAVRTGMEPRIIYAMEEQ